jgi:hypothetical protein
MRNCYRELLGLKGCDEGSEKLIATARLYHASADGDTAAVRQLIKEGADVLARDMYGMTAVDRYDHVRGRHELLKLLL